MKCLALWVAAIALGTSSMGWSAQTLGTTSVNNSGVPVGYAFFDPSVNFVIAQSFILNQSVPVASLAVYLHGNGTPAPQDPFKLELTNSIGAAATAANLIFSSPGTFPTTGVDEVGPVTFFPALTLAPGKYYIVLSSAQGLRCGWGTDGDILPSTLGTVSDGYIGFGANGSVGDYHSLSENDLNQTHMNFLVTALPEPTTIAMLPASVALLRRRR